MEGGIDADVPLDYATIQIFPTENRYEAYVCSDNKVEKLAVGTLEHLLPHLPGVKDLYSEGSNALFKIQLPGNLNGARWFTKSTLDRFLHVVGSMDLVSATKIIEGEINQLEEARKFHLSLYCAQGAQDHFRSISRDVCNNIDEAPTFKPQNQIASSDTSKNELLRAIDLRLTALRREFAVAFHQAAGATCSNEEITDLAKFCWTFGAPDLKDFLCKSSELSRKSQTADAIDDEKLSFACGVSNIILGKIDGNTQIPKPVNLETPVKYGVSPAKVAQVERQSSTESEESSDSSEENKKSVERSRALVRSASPRRSASPMRRVQIGRMGPHRATSLTIKSLNHFPAREKTSCYRDVTPESSEEEESEVTKKLENNIHRMSVQDAINLFESKQRDQNADVNKWSTLNIAPSANKSVLRRWSTGMRASSTQCQLHLASGDCVSTTSNDVVHTKESKSSLEVNLEHGEKDLVEAAEVDAKLQGENNLVETAEVDAKLGENYLVEAAEVDVKLGEERISSAPINTQANTDITQREDIDQRLTGAVEWSEETELNQMVKKMGNNPGKHKRPPPGVKKNLPSEQRGGLYNHYKEKRDEKLRGENVGKRAEKEAQFRALQQILDERKAQMASTNVNNVGKKHPPRNSLKTMNNPSQPANLGKESPKPSQTKKSSSKPSSLPATRKSWPSTPFPWATGASSARAATAISSTGTTATCYKPQQMPSSLGPGPKGEGSQPQQKKVKKTQTNMDRNTRCLNEKQPQRVTKGSKTTKIKVATASGDSSSTVPAKPTIMRVTKKSSVVPVEPKPSIRKGLGIGPGIAPVANKVKRSQSDEALKKSGTMMEAEQTEVAVNVSVEESEHQEVGILSLGCCEAADGTETTANSHLEHDELGKFDRLIVDGDDGFKDRAMSSQIVAEEEPIISPCAWVEIEEHENLPNRCFDSASELASSGNNAPVHLSSPRIRHSLSQMLQEESSEPDIIGWGNAENPPAVVYQKDAPKGLKRLLKFGRKNKGDTNITGLSSPSVFSEGEDEGEESKIHSKRNADNLLRKTSFHAKNYGHYSEGYEKNMDSYEHLSAQSNLRKFDGQTSAPTTKATRSFFSLSALMGSKPNETKLR